MASNLTPQALAEKRLFHNRSRLLSTDSRE